MVGLEARTKRDEKGSLEGKKETRVQFSIDWELQSDDDDDDDGDDSPEEGLLLVRCSSWRRCLR